MKNNILIRCQEIGYKCDQSPILEKISFDVIKGDIITIIGPNGAGKTTLGKILARILNATTGKFSIKKGLKIGYMPQKIHINELVPITGQTFLFLNIPKKTLLNTNIDQIINDTDINNILKKQVQNISGGEWQRLLLARILLRDPDLLILDEPTQGLDINGQQNFYNLLNKIKLKQEKTIIMISHDLYTVMKSSNNILCLNKHICCSGIPKEIKEHKSYKKLFNIPKSEIIAHYVHDHNSKRI